MNKILRTGLIVLLILTFIGTLGFLYSKSNEKPVTYKTDTPYYTDIVKKIVATGSIVPKNEVAVKPRISGIIQEILVEPGQHVQKGDLIAKVEIIPDMARLSEAETRINQAQIRYNNAKREYERNKHLLDKDAISDVQFRQYEQDYHSASEELQAAKDNIELVKKGVSGRTGSSSNTRVTSTISGMILDVPVEEGNSVIESNNFNEGTTIASIADMNDMIFKGVVDESEVGKLHEDMPIVLSIGALQDKKFDGVLTYIAPKGVEENGAITFEIKADVHLKEDDFLRAGYSANADIILQKADTAFSVKESWLKFDENGKPFVEVLKGQNYTKKYITTGLSDGINIQILSGLTETEKIKAGLSEK